MRLHFTITWNNMHFYLSEPRKSYGTFDFVKQRGKCGSWLFIARYKQ